MPVGVLVEGFEKQLCCFRILGLSLRGMGRHLALVFGACRQFSLCACDARGRALASGPRTARLLRRWRRRSLGLTASATTGEAAAAPKGGRELRRVQHAITIAVETGKSFHRLLAIDALEVGEGRKLVLVHALVTIRVQRHHGTLCLFWARVMRDRLPIPLRGAALEELQKRGAALGHNLGQLLRLAGAWGCGSRHPEAHQDLGQEAAQRRCCRCCGAAPHGEPWFATG
mmetsp:Transcript_30643/g.65201  ORF Transcript_30643/g.65201 Transcript_30643/m.65201 type:complete len:229 (-) Transcript_30643:91-777(-)